MAPLARHAGGVNAFTDQECPLALHGVAAEAIVRAWDAIIKRTFIARG
jgi:hypothetical protein